MSCRKGELYVTETRTGKSTWTEWAQRGKAGAIINRTNKIPNLTTVVPGECYPLWRTIQMCRQRLLQKFYRTFENSIEPLWARSQIFSLVILISKNFAIITVRLIRTLENLLLHNLDNALQRLLKQKFNLLKSSNKNNNIFFLITAT